MNQTATNTLIDVQALTDVVLDSYNEAHKMMADLANRVYDLLIAARAGDEHDHAISESLEMLIRHTALQFEYEDSEMREAGFPGNIQHTEAHRASLLKLTEARLHWLREGDKEALDYYLTDSLTPWLIDHIDQMDTVAAMYIAAGRKQQAQ